MDETIHVDRHLDAKGMLCPMPVISVKRAIKDLQRGQVIAIQATDKGACRDIPAWAEQTGHKLLTWTDENNTLTFYIEKAGWEDEEEW
jgi:tRNA 2-thiouridine synthesizing protein A